MATPVDVISYHGVSASGASRNLLWPCQIFAVSLLAGQERLNIFENAVLRLLGAGVEDMAHIEEILAFKSGEEENEGGLAEFILARLEQKGLVEKGRLNESGKKFLANRVVGETTTAWIFRDLASGKLLPFIDSESPKFLIPDNEHSYYLSEIGGEKLAYSWKLKFGHAYYGAPSVKDAISAIREYFRLRESRACLPGFERKGKKYILNETSLAIQNLPQMAYLHCIADLSADGAHILVRNPFGLDDISGSLSQSLASCESYDKLYKEMLGRAQSSISMEFGSIEIGAARGLSPESVKQLNILVSARKKGLAGRGSLVRAIYALLERAFHALYQENDNNKSYGELLCHSGGRPDLALKSAEKLGFTLVGTDAARFLSIPAHEYASVLEGRLKLRAQLGLQLLVAAGTDSHPFIRLAQEFPEAIQLLQKLVEYRNASAHGEAKGARISEIDAEAYWNLCKSFLQAWKPGKFDFLNDILPLDQGSDGGLGARKSLLAFFPKSLLDALSAAESGSLLNAEEEFLAQNLPASTEKDGSIPVDAITALSAFCEHILRSLRPATYPPVHGIKELAAKKAREAGFQMDGENLPSGLASVNEDKIAKTLEGARLSLGCEGMAWLASAPEEKLAAIAESRPALLLNISNLSILRGHAAGEVPAAEAATLRIAIYQDMAIIIGFRRKAHGNQA